MSDEDAWLRFSDVAVNARLRNEMELFRSRKAGRSGNLTATATEGSVKLGAVAVSAALAGSSADLKELPAALTWEGAGVAAGLASEDAKTRDGGELNTTQSAHSISAPTLKSASAEQREQIA